MSLVRRNYYRPKSFFPTVFNDLFADDFLAKPVSNTKKVAQKQHTAVNIKEDEDRFLIEIAVPGFQKEDFNIEFDKGKLTISAEVEQNEEKEADNYTYQEFMTQSFKRGFTVPEDKVAIDEIGATYKAGLLYVTLPKKEEEAKRRIDIQ